MVADVIATPEQRLSWSYYGMPEKAAGGSRSAGTPSGNQVGEVRYIVGWMADQMVRMGWRVTLDGSESWEITGQDGELVRSVADESDTEAPTHPARASLKLLESIGWTSSIVRQITTNLFVAGECHYAAFSDDTWQVISVIHPQGKELRKKASILVRGIWPHPADPDAPDAPMFGVLPVLDDMSWLNRLSRSQSANRVSMRGILGVSNDMTTATGEGGEQFWDSFERALSRPMDDPSDVSPVGLRGATDLIKPEGKGMGGLSWVIPEFPYDDKIDSRMEKLVERLAYGLPVPPEILLGLQAQSKATAFQVEGATYRAHIEPAALLVASVGTDALSRMLEVEGALAVVPDPTQILARRHSVQDVLEAYDRGGVGIDYMLEVLGIPARAKPTEADLQVRERIRGRAAVREGARDPGNVAADEPIAAAVQIPEGEVQDAAPSEPETPDDEHLSLVLGRIDEQVLDELTGAATQAVSHARAKLGAAVRSKGRAITKEIPSDLTNEEIPLKIGADVLEALGIDVEAVLSPVVDQLSVYWSGRAMRAQDDVNKLLAPGSVVVEFSTTAIRESDELLASVTRAGVFEEAGVSPEALRKVVDTAGL